MTSIAECMYNRDPRNQYYLGDSVHVIGGFSKDFCISGLRAGTLFTHNQDLLEAIGNLGLFSAVSNQTQWCLTQILVDDGWVARYLAENQKRLKCRYDALKDALGAIGVRVHPCRSTLMAWADFRPLLKDETR